MSRVMDVFFDLQHTNIKFLNKIKQRYQCENNECDILESVVKTRKHVLRSRIPNKMQNNNKLLRLQLSSEEYCMMELLEFVHVRLFHKEEHYRNRLPNRAGISTSEFDIQIGKDNENKVNILFKDKLNHSLKLLDLFCDQYDYDSEALYDDIFPDQDGQSNIYKFFECNLKSKMNEYHLLKDELSRYTINPVDKQAMERNLIDLDFGQHVTDWNIQPQFAHMKDEWLENDFFQISNDIYKSLQIKSKIIAKQAHNKSTYNFSQHDILCIKVYTDTNELQANFRHAFRCSSDKKRRSQFIHWATQISVIFLKIEVENQVYKYNKDICDVTLYHGLNRLFNTRGLVRQFYGLLSTTWELSVAETFAGGSGMILQINKDVNFKNANALAVDWISCHDNEQEVLLMNPQVIIEKSYVFSKDFQMKVSYFKSTLLS
eukprot:101222_1